MFLANAIKNRYVLLSMAMVLQFFMLSTGFAQSVGFAEPAASDMSRQFINQIFGGLLDGGSDAFGASITTFNGAVLIVGGLLVAYTIFAGTLGTAHDGEMLGKKFSSVWVPVRTALGTALVLPVMSGGYCVMQALVMWLIMQGVSLGNMIWSNYMSNPPQLQAKISPIAKDNIRKFVQDVFIAQVCVQSQKRAYDELPAMVKAVGGTYNFTAVKNSSGTWEFGDHGGLITNKNSCGEVTPPPKPEIRIASSAATTLSSLNSLNSVFKTPDLMPIYNAHLNQIDNIVNQTGPLAAKAIDRSQTFNESDLENLSNNYLQAIETAGASLASSTNMSAVANQQGWFMAGTWATQIIFMQNKITSAVNSLGEAAPRITKVNSSASDQVSAYMAEGYKKIVSLRPELTNMTLNASGKKGDDVEDAQEVGVVGKVVGWLTKKITTIDFENIKTDDRHPLILMNQIGDRVLNVIFGSMIGVAGIAALAGIKVAGTGLDMTATFVAVYGTLGIPLAAGIGGAGMLAYILPNTPFLIWIGIIVGWTIMVIEAILAAPLWAVMHLHPNGDDVTGRGGNGYMLVLGLLLRPALIIFGLIAAIILSGLFGKFVNLVFFDLFTANTMSGGLGFFGMIFGVCLYGGVMFLVLKNTFSLMHIIPDQLLRWIGGGGEQLGNYANQMSEGSIQKGTALAAGAAAYTMQKTLQSSGEALGQAKEIRATRQAAFAQEQSNEMQKLSGYQAKDASEGVGAGLVDQQIDNFFNNSANPGNKEEGQQANFAAMQAKSQASFASKALGGKDSPQTLQYRQALMEGMVGGQTFNDAHQAAFSKAFDDKYGEGSYAVANTIAESDAKDGSGNVNTSLANLSIERTASMLNAKMNNLTRHGGMDEESAKGAISDMMTKTMNTYSNDGGNIKSILASNSKDVNRNAGIVRGGDEAPVKGSDPD